MLLNRNHFTRARAWAANHGPNHARGVGNLASRNLAAAKAGGAIRDRLDAMTAQFCALPNSKSGQHYFDAGEVTSFWKRGSFRSGSNIGSNRSSARVSGTLLANGPAYGMTSNFCKAAIARSGSPMRAATRARISSETGPRIASFSIGFAAIPRSDRANVLALSPRPIMVRARSPRRL